MPIVNAFCASCGGNVECDVTTVGNKRRTTCKNCQFLIEEKQVTIAAPAPAAPAAPKTLGTVLSAEDIPTLRTALQSMLVQKGVAKQVVSTENGFDALVAFHQALKNRVKLDLLILDVNMPILDGINLAVCVRAAEKAYKLPPHPILFFTSNVCDESFRRALEYLSPARYINKGTGNSAEEFGDRLVTVVRNLLAGVPPAG